MEIVNFITAGLMILLGLLVKKFPNMIAGYNTMTKEQQRNVNINGLSSHIRNCFIVIGFVIIIVSLLSILFNFNKVAIFVIPVSLIVMLPYLLIKAQKFDRNK